MTKLSRNVVYNLVGQALLLAMNFVAVRYVFGRLGDDAVGIIYFSLALNAALCTLLDMGVSTILVREISSHIKGDPGYVRALTRSAVFLATVAVAVLMIAVILAAPALVHRWVRLRDTEPAVAITAMRMLGAGATLILLQRLLSSIVRGIERMEWSNIIDVVTLALQQLGTIVLVVVHGGIVAVACWYAACYAASIVAYVIVVSRLLSWRMLVPRYSQEAVKKNLGYGASMTWISVLSMVHIYADKAFLSKLLPLGQLGTYGFSYTLVSKTSMLTEALAQAVLPRFSFLAAAGDSAMLKRQYDKAQDAACASSVPLLAGIVFAAVPGLTMLFDANIATALRLPIVLLCLGAYLHTTLVIPYYLSLACGRPDISVRANVWALMATVPATGLLIYWFGLVGAGASWIVYNAFVGTLVMPSISADCLGLAWTRWSRHTFKFLGWGVVSYATAWCVVGWLGARTVLELAVAYLGATVVFAIGAYRMLGDDIREVLGRWSAYLGTRLGRAT
jgi:O-antigen/teichoic acid export membrane protein